jgi:hypothetical protein
MDSESLKEEYKTPRADVRGVFLEGAIADSQDLRVGSDVKYEEYEEIEVGNSTGKDLLVF